jgi:oxygen-independent coproporphyrinogen-3 oxidase
MAKSLYIHIPFCRKKCGYCDFYSRPYSEGSVSLYIDILCRQIKDLKNSFRTIYIGGGTPTVLSVDLWAKLLKSLKKFTRSGLEFTIEANPESLDEAKVKLFKAQGVNRLSIGVQSLFDKKLKQLGRIHSAQDAVAKVLLAKNNGFNNLNADFIFGLAGESLDGWKKELRQIVKLPLKHISLYALTYSEVASEEITSRIYKYNQSYLPKKGFRHYEVSNFSKKGYESQHNLNYWDNSSYLGLGPSAVSYHQGLRQKNIADLGKYLQKQTIASKEELSPLKRAKETAALKIRTSQGIDFKWFKKQTGFDFKKLEAEALEGIRGQGLVKYAKTKVYLTAKGFLFSDAVSRALV